MMSESHICKTMFFQQKHTYLKYDLDCIHPVGRNSV